MSIDSLRSGAIRVCFSDAANAYPSRCRILLEGQMLDTGTAEDGKLIKIPSLRDVDTLFGAGSVIAEGLKTSFGCCPDQSMEHYALPHKDASVGSVTKAVYTMTFAGTAATDGRIDLYAGDGRWNTSTHITAGMTDQDVALAVAASLQALIGFPFDVLPTPTGGGGMTLTAKNAGTVGNCLNVIYNWHERRDYAPVGVTMTFAQTVTVFNGAFQYPDYAAILGECCYCCIGFLFSDPAWQNAGIAYVADQWSCEKPACFGHSYTYNIGTLGQILATDTNSPEVSRLAQCCDDPILGYLKVAAFTGQSCCSTVDHPELSVEGPNYGVLACITQPESCVQCFTFEETQILQQSGFVVTVPLVGGTGALTSPMIVGDITNSRYDENGKLNLTWRNTSSRRLAAATADSIAIELSKSLGLGLYTKNTTVPQGINGTNPRMILGSLRSWAKSQVGILFSEFENLDKDLTLQTDFEVAPKCQGIPGKLHVTMVYRPPVRISNIFVNAYPTLLDNCH
jgi:hypothetical protein